LSGNLTLGLLELAFAIFALLGGVRIVTLEFLAMLLEVLEASILLTTIATSIDSVTAGNKFLLGEAEQLASLLPVSSFHGGGHREGPA
jgi:hypothetical protein